MSVQACAPSATQPPPSTALRAVRDYARGAASYANASADEQARQKQLKPDVVHSLVKTHPETGRKALYVDEFVRNFEGMTDEESKPLLDFLLQHATRYEFIYRHRWTAGDLLLWDNRCTSHARTDFDPTERRHLRRFTIKGTKPV